jgi:hypothetical protein
MPIFEDVLARYAGLSETRLSEPWRWPGHDGAELEVRDALLRSLELELAVLATLNVAVSLEDETWGLALRVVPPEWWDQHTVQLAAAAHPHGRRPRRLGSGR